MDFSSGPIEPQLPPSYGYKTEPYNHQIAAYNFCINKDFFALFMEQGTGKTKTLIDIANALYLKGEITAVMIVAPNGVHRQWAVEQLPKHSHIPYEHFVFKSTMPKGLKLLFKKFITEPKDKLKWLMVNVEAFSHETHIGSFKDFLRNNRTFLAIDEATSIKSPTATRTIALLSWLGDAQYRGKRLVAYKPYSVKRAILTGTPVTNSVYDLWSMFYFLKPDFFGRTFYSFKAHFGIEAVMQIYVKGVERKITKLATRTDIRRIRKLLEEGESFLAIAEKTNVRPEDVLYLQAHPDCEVPYKNLSELKKTIAPFAFYARKKDCYDLPPKTYEKIIVELTKEQRRLYEDLKNEYITQFYDAEVSVAQKVALYTRLSQIAGGFLPYEDEEGVKEIRPTDKSNPKMDALVHKLNEATYPVLVTTRFRAEATELKARIEKSYPELNVKLLLGGVKGRDSILEDYKKGLVDVLVANEALIHEGHNLQMGDTIYRYSYGYSIKINEQLEDRIHRDGQLSDKCLYVFFIAENTLDEEIYVALQSGKSLLDYMRDRTIKEFLTVKSEDAVKEFKQGENDE